MQMQNLWHEMLVGFNVRQCELSFLADQNGPPHTNICKHCYVSARAVTKERGEGRSIAEKEAVTNMSETVFDHQRRKHRFHFAGENNLDYFNLLQP